MIHHLAEPGAWDAVTPERAYEAGSLASEGFIHLSTPAQLSITFARFYADRTDLVLLDVDDTHPALVDLLRWEEIPGGEVFPHVYGPLPVEAVLRVRPHWRPDINEA